MTIFTISLILSVWLCSLVAGLLFIYAIVVMPGFKKLDDKSFIQAFQVTDRIIQNNHPLFLLVWLGSAISIIALTISGFNKLNGGDFFIMLLATVSYIIGVQCLTIFIHLPLNNTLQKIDVDHADQQQLKLARLAFESRWNRSNQVRAFISCGVSLMLILLTYQV